MIDDHKGDILQGRTAVGYGSNTWGTTGPIGIGQRRWRGERDDYRRGKLSILRGCIGLRTEFAEPRLEASGTGVLLEVQSLTTH